MSVLPVLPQGFVVGRILTSRGDSADADKLADTAVVVGMVVRGKVTPNANVAERVDKHGTVIAGEANDQVLTGQPALDRFDAGLRIEPVQGRPRRGHLGQAHHVRRMQYLTLQVGEVDGVVIGDRDRAHARRGEIHGGRRAQPARADDQRPRIEQGLLTLDIDFGQQDVPAVAQELVVVHRDYLYSRKSSGVSSWSPWTWWSQAWT